MKTETLKKHIIDTVKEWQMKIGYMDEDMKLYYPMDSLKTMLGLEKNVEKVELDHALQKFAENVRGELGELKITDSNGRYCLDISPEGCAWIEENVPEPGFLKALLAIITSGDKGMEEVRRCFGEYAKKYGCSYTEENESCHGMGHVFFFDDPASDEYVYCVEENEFGLTYHRFGRDDYKNEMP
ncbi:MAG: DUF3877 family protein [Eubacteriales bacterium]|nr:DUF3877 family protein [Eubacteriales bacterium]